MRLLKYIILLLAAIVLCSMLVGLLVLFAVWELTGGNPPMPAAYIFRVSSISAGMIVTVYYISKLSLLAAKDRAIKGIMYEEGVTREVILYYKQQADKAKTRSAKDVNRLVLAAYLAEGSYFKECFDILRSVDVQALPMRWQEEYYNIYVYANLMMGDISAARQIYEDFRQYFERAMLRSDNAAVLHTLGVLEYASCSYVKAESLLDRAKSRSDDRANRCECNLYLGLCYLKTGRPRYAKLAAEEASRCVVTLYHRQNLEKLKRLVEKAYAADPSAVDGIQTAQPVRPSHEEGFADYTHNINAPDNIDNTDNAE